MASTHWHGPGLNLLPPDEIARTLTTQPIRLAEANKVKIFWVPFGGASHISDQIFHAPGAKLWHYAVQLRTLSVAYPLCCSALTNTTDNPSETRPLKLTDFCLFLYNLSLIHI